MNRDDSDLCSLPDEDDYQEINMTELGEPKKDILNYFAFRLSIALLKKPSLTHSLAEDENEEPPAKR
ncbi:hypothetical protein TNCV_4259581 [Trichonephila clavipes]|nr:hypothetical protein TNCV_4259581 [Trichonephila clavipes]